MPSKWNKSAATLFERFVCNLPSLADLQSVEMAVKELLDYPCRSHHFYTSTFSSVFRINKVYFAYRWLICTLCFISCFITFFEIGSDEPKSLEWYFKYPIYQTNISLILAWAQTLLGAVIITLGVKSYGFKTAVPIDENIEKHQLIYWKLQEFATLSALSVTATFWLVVNPKNPHKITLCNILGHSVNSVYALTDWLITGLPYNFSDVWITIVYGLAYFLFTYVYWEAGGTGRHKSADGTPARALYHKCTDWNDPKIAVVCCFVSISLAAMLHVVLVGLNKLRARRMLKPSPAAERSKVV